jgi:hypothetical protein
MSLLGQGPSTRVRDGQRHCSTSVLVAVKGIGQGVPTRLTRDQSSCHRENASGPQSGGGCSFCLPPRFLIFERLGVNF